MEVLTLAECEEALRNPPVPSKVLSRILESLIAHIQVNQNASETVVKMMKDIKELISPMFQRLDILEKELGDSKKELEETKKELEETKKELKETKKDLEEMKKKWESLKTLEDNLLIGQLAFTLEEELVIEFLKDTDISPKHVTIHQIFIALRNENDYMLPLTPEQKVIINANLKKLEREYQLDHRLYLTITALKKGRNTKAHPSIENISTHLSDMVSPSDKEAVDRMLAILQNLRGRNAK